MAGRREPLLEISESYLYAMNFLPFHLVSAKDGASLIKLLTSPGFLSDKIWLFGINELNNDFEFLSMFENGLDQPALLRLVRTTLILSADAISTSPEQLASQLFARLSSQVDPSVVPFLKGLAQCTKRAWLRPITSNITPSQNLLRRSVIFSEFSSVPKTYFGRWVIASLEDNRVLVQDMVSGQQVRSFNVPPGWSPSGITSDGRRIILRSDEAIFLVQIETLELLSCIPCDKHAEVTIDFNALYILQRSGNAIDIWNLINEQRQILELRTGASRQPPLDFRNYSIATLSGGARRIALGSDHQLLVLDIGGSQIERSRLLTIPGSRNDKSVCRSIGLLATTPDSKVVVGCMHLTKLHPFHLHLDESKMSQLYIWNEARPNKIVMCPRLPFQVESLTITDDGRYALVGTAQAYVSITDLESGTLVAAWRCHPTAVSDISFNSSEWTLTSADRSGQVRLWELAKTPNISSKPLLRRKVPSPITRCGQTLKSFLQDALAPRGFMVPARDEHGEAWRKIGIEDSREIAAVRLSRDGRVAAFADNREINSFDTSTGIELDRFKDSWIHGAKVIAIDDRRNILVAADGKRVAGWKLSNRKRINSMSCMYSDKESLLGRIVNGVFASFDERKFPVTLSSDGVFLAGMLDCHIVVWDTYSGKHVAQFDHCPNWLSFSSSGEWLLASDNHKLVICHTFTNRELRRFSALESVEDFVTGMAISGNGKLALTAHTNGFAKIWRLPGGELEGSIPSIFLHQSGLWSYFDGFPIPLRLTAPICIDNVANIAVVADSHVLRVISLSDGGSQLAEFVANDRIISCDIAYSARRVVAGDIAGRRYIFAIENLGGDHSSI